MSHGIAAVVALGAVGWLLAHTPPTVPSWAVVVYGISLISLFTISSTYHWITWPPATRARLRRLDHSAIFFLIAGTYTPVVLIALPPGPAQKVLTLVWVGAALGVVKSLLPIKAPRAVTAGLYLLLGWTIMLEWTAIEAVLTATELGLMFAGGALYTVGALAYATRWPDPVPAVFGYHEVFHLLVIGAAACHFGMVSSLVL